MTSNRERERSHRAYRAAFERTARVERIIIVALVLLAACIIAGSGIIWR